MTTLIEWTDETWNPVTGCHKVSPGCDHCYAERITNRFGGPGAFDTVVLHPERLEMPLRWRKPRMVFVNSMSDLFHDDVPDEFVAQVFAIMGLARRHTFQVLTKRPGRMASLLGRGGFGPWVETEAEHLIQDDSTPLTLQERRSFYRTLNLWYPITRWPLRNVWLGTSVETQKWADVRIPKLLETPAAVRFLSCEPLLGPIDLTRMRDPLGCNCGPAGEQGVHEPWCGTISALREGTDWVIAGGESGPGARPMDMQWARSLVEQCRAAGVPAFVKQLGTHPGFQLEDEERRGNPAPSFHHFDEASGLYIKALDDHKGGDPSEWPEDLRIRERPERAS